MITWSHSRIADYLQCPFKFYEKHVRKSVKQVETEAMRKGTAIHKLLECVINCTDEKELEIRKRGLTESMLGPVIPILDKMRSLGAAAELELGVKRDWSPCGFWDEEVWGRCKIDVLAADSQGRGIIVDWKTGATKNIKYQTENELKLHAMIAHAHFPELKAVSGVYYYTQGFQFHPKPPEKPYAFYSFMADRYNVNKLIERVEYAVNSEKCGTRKNALCPWCEVKHCKHYKPKEKA